MEAFQNAYDFALAYVLQLFSDYEVVTEEQIYLTAEEQLRDWDAFAGARHTNYNTEAYELTDEQWEDCLSAVRETAEARLWDKLER